MLGKTVVAFLDHGQVRASLEENIEGARQVIANLLDMSRIEGGVPPLCERTSSRSVRMISAPV